MNEKIGSYDVLTANSILIEVGKPIRISLGNEDSLVFIYNIINDPGKEKYTSEARLVNQKTIELDLYNFVSNNLGGGGTKHPVRVGSFQKRALYYAFYVHSAGFGVQPLFSYTFYLGEEVENG